MHKKNIHMERPTFPSLLEGSTVMVNCEYWGIIQSYK